MITERGMAMIARVERVRKIFGPVSPDWDDPTTAS